MREYRLHDLRDRIGYVPQKAFMFKGTVDSNVRYGDGSEEVTEEQVRRAVRIAQATEFVEAKEGQYESEVAQGGSNLSGGQKQRLSIARAVCRDPEIYIFDDSFSALDYRTDRVLRETLRNEISDATTLIVAQRIGTIMEADRIVVVDDGSTDGSADAVRAIASPLVKLVTQANAGVCAARNRAIAESAGDLIALLDADDTWEPGFLEEIASMAAEFPGCGIYSTAFNIVSHDGRFPAPTPTERGVVADFFRDSAHRYISIPSASAVPRAVFESVGGFPEGMKIGEDLYMWIKIARRYKVCFSPKPLANYSKVASNRSSAIYTPERTRYSFEELYDPAAADGYNEFVARAALGKALIISAKGGTKDAARAIRFFGYTKTYRRTLRKVRILNALPRSWRGPLIGLYNSLAWRIARKGL